ncbi:MAG: asparaginase [Epsilonproteobacteria bacterium]|nr:asparaginase [Campylobacterales bacterium]MBD3824825.1 asparaginase [Campylobacterota bacterium]
MLILNVGGTFNKIYNPLDGSLEVPYDNSAIENILTSYMDEKNIAGAIYKDSLDMTMDDRKMLASIIHASNETQFIVVHGTDTMKLSAEFLHEIFVDKTVVFTGAMRPYQINNTESALNLGMAIGFMKANPPYGIYICMNGFIKPFNEIEKNRALGRFEVV